MSIVIPAVSSNSVRHALFIKLTVNGTDYYISNAYKSFTYAGDTYIGLGHFLGFDQIQDDLRSTNNTLQVTLSGIPKNALATPDALPGYASYIAFILDQKIKGSLIKIYRAFFDTSTGDLLTSSVSMRFSGYISNYTITDGLEFSAKDNTRTVVIQCSSINGVLERKIAGRRTNSVDQKFFFPGDTGMDRVLAISNTAFDFGKPYSGAGTGGLSGSDPGIDPTGGGGG